MLEAKLRSAIDSANENSVEYQKETARTIREEIQPGVGSEVWLFKEGRRTFEILRAVTANLLTLGRRRDRLGLGMAIAPLAAALQNVELEDIPDEMKDAVDDLFSEDNMKYLTIPWLLRKYQEGINISDRDAMASYEEMQIIDDALHQLFTEDVSFDDLEQYCTLTGYQKYDAEKLMELAKMFFMTMSKTQANKLTEDNAARFQTLRAGILEADPMSSDAEVGQLSVKMLMVERMQQDLHPVDDEPLDAERFADYLIEINRDSAAAMME